ncbi:MAG: efflux RND transporter periplasmic adaptor subunit [Bacteroidota bacterium]|nr:efflux RND transporter periplasmic adaptor subunit [Bacteroidota bacterium]
MKHILTIAVALFLISCGGEKTAEELIAAGDKQALATKKSELKKQKETIEKTIAKIEAYEKKSKGEAIKAQVSTMVLKDTLFNHYVELQGSVDTKQNITVMPETAGLLTQVYVKEGQRVSKGQRLARIDDGGAAQNLEQMKVQAQLAKTTYERQKRLWEQNIGSEIQYLQSKANYEAQERSINAMQQQLAKTVVTAPFSGTIDDVITEQGNVVSPGMPLFRLVSLKDMYLKVDVPETYLTAINKNTDVIVEFPVLGETVKSKIRQTSNYINPSNRSFSIEVPVDNKSGNIKPNLTAKLRINDYTSKNAILVPLNVINENQDGDQYVMVTAQGENGLIAKRREITTGKASGDYIEILSGLEPGDEIITEGARSVKPDQEINIINS